MAGQFFEEKVIHQLIYAFGHMFYRSIVIDVILYLSNKQ